MSNEIDSLFVKASRKKLRFPSSKGSLNVEDLWDLSLESLDKIAVEIDENIQKEGRKSFIGKRNTISNNTLSLDILKFVITTKQDEEEKRKDRAEKNAQKEFLTDLLQQKKIESLKGLSAEEIQKKIAEIEA